MYDTGIDSSGFSLIEWQKWFLLGSIGIDNLMAKPQAAFCNMLSGI
jgi:hypothetical protein